MPIVRESLAGKTMGPWKVTRRAKRSISGNRAVHVVCVRCGVKRVKLETHLRQGIYRHVSCAARDPEQDQERALAFMLRQLERLEPPQQREVVRLLAIRAGLTCVDHSDKGAQ